MLARPGRGAASESDSESPAANAIASDLGLRVSRSEFAGGSNSSPLSKSEARVDPGSAAARSRSAAASLEPQ